MDELPAPVYRTLYAHAQKLARGTSPFIEVADLMQEAHLRIWRDGITIHSLAITCGRRAMVDAVRTQAGRIGSSKHTVNSSVSRYDGWTDFDGNPSEDPLSEMGYSAPSAETEALEQIAVAHVVDLVDELDPRTRDLLHSLEAGDSLRSVGERYGVTESRMCQLRSKTAKRLLRKLAA